MEKSKQQARRFASEILRLESGRRRVEEMVRTVSKIQEDFSALHLKEPSAKDYKLNRDKIERAKTRWNSSLTTVEEKIGLIKVELQDLRTYVESLQDKDPMVMDLYLEIIGFLEDTKTWKFWECCQCEQKSAELDSYSRHLLDLHALGFNKKLKSLLHPGKVNDVAAMMIKNGELEPLDSDKFVNQLKSGSFSHQGWPSCDDSKRKVVLEKIRRMFQLLLQHGYLSQSHIGEAIEFTVDEFQGKIPAQQLRDLGLAVIGISSVSQLRNILEYLNSLASFFGNLTENPQISSIDDLLKLSRPFNIKESIVYGGDSSFLLLDKRLLRAELNLRNYSKVDAHAASALSSTGDVHEDDVLAHGDEIMSWLYTGLNITKALETWRILRNSQKEKAKHVYEIFEDEYQHLERTYKKKLEHEDKRKAVDMLKKSLQKQNLQDSCASLIRREQKVIAHKLDYISNVVRREKTCMADRFRSEENKFKHLNLTDHSLQEQIKREMKRLDRAILPYDAMILRSSSVLTKYRVQFCQVSAYDYRSIMLPLLKSFIQSRLEDLICKDTKEYISATKDLSESAERDNLRQTKKTTKKKKNKNKKKDNKKANNFLTTQGNEQPLFHQDDTQQFGHSTGVPIIGEENVDQEEILHDSSLKNDSGTQNQLNVKNSQGDSGSTFGVGIRNVGENSCFLNVIIQSLWHLKEFRRNFVFEPETHNDHAKDQCVVCALNEIFDQLSTASRNNQRQAVSSMVLRRALIYLHPNNYKMEDKHDAVEAWGTIFSSLHRWFTFGSDDPNDVSRANCNYSSNACLVHKFFGVKVTLETIGESYSNKDIHISDMVNLNTNELREQKSKKEKFSFDDAVTNELQNMVRGQVETASLNDDIDWVPLNFITIVLHWITGIESKAEISETLSCLSTELHIGPQGSDRRKQYSLVSMICYLRSAEHYYCFIYNHEHGKWFVYDDAYVKDFGSWIDVFAHCIEKCVQPVALTFKNTQLEDQFHKGIAEKSDAAIEAPPAELSIDEERNVNKICDDERQRKDKEKNKSFEKTEESQETSDVQHFQIHQNDAGQDPNSEIEVSLTAAHDENLLNKNEKMRESVGENLGEVGSVISSKDCEDDFQKAVCLSLGEMYDGSESKEVNGQKTQLEDQFNKGTTEKSDAAMETLPAELSLDEERQTEDKENKSFNKAEESQETAAHDEIKPPEYSGNKMQRENRATETCTAEKYKKEGDFVGENPGEGVIGAKFDGSESKEDTARWRDENVQTILDQIAQLDYNRNKLAVNVQEAVKEVKEMKDDISHLKDDMSQMKDDMSQMKDDISHLKDKMLNEFLIGNRR